MDMKRMKNLMITTAACAALTAASSANAQGMGGDFYASVFGGYIFGEATAEASLGVATVEQSVDLENGFTVGATVGTSIAANLRAEAEVSYARYAAGDVSGSVSYAGTSYDLPTYAAGDDVVYTATYLLGNVWYDIPTGSGFTPYVGGGLGLAFFSGDNDGQEIFEPTNGFAYQFGGGIQVPVGPGTFDLGYRFKGFTGADIDGLEVSSGPDTVVLPSADGSGSSSSLQAGYVIKF